MKRYDLVIDINLPEDSAIMHECKGGTYAVADEAEAEKMELVYQVGDLVKALTNLKNCDSRVISAEVLNAYVDNVLYGYFTDED